MFFLFVFAPPTLVRCAYSGHFRVPYTCKNHRFRNPDQKNLEIKSLNNSEVNPQLRLAETQLVLFQISLCHVTTNCCVHIPALAIPVAKSKSISISKLICSSSQAIAGSKLLELMPGALAVVLIGILGSKPTLVAGS